jgi:hypothetical protein
MAGAVQLDRQTDELALRSPDPQRPEDEQDPQRSAVER